MARDHYGNMDIETVKISVEDWAEITKVLRWVRDNQAIHPNNIRYELLKLAEKHIGVN